MIKTRADVDWVQARTMEISEKRGISPAEARPQALKDLDIRQKKAASAKTTKKKKTTAK